MSTNSTGIVSHFLEIRSWQRKSPWRRLPWQRKFLPDLIHDRRKIASECDSMNIGTANMTETDTLATAKTVWNIQPFPRLAETGLFRVSSEA